MPTKVPHVIPYLYYEDVPAAIAFLTRAFGFKGRMRVGAPSGGMHAEVEFGNQVLMLGQGATDKRHGSPRKAGISTAGVFVYLANVDAHYARAREAGADIAEAPKNESYGRSYSALDPESHSWFSRRRRRCKLPA